MKSRVNFIVPVGKFVLGTVLQSVASHKKKKKKIKKASQKHDVCFTMLNRAPHENPLKHNSSLKVELFKSRT